MSRTMMSIPHTNLVNARATVTNILTQKGFSEIDYGNEKCNGTNQRGYKIIKKIRSVCFGFFS